MSFVYKTELTSEHGKKVVEALAALGKNDPKAFFEKDCGFYGQNMNTFLHKILKKGEDKVKVENLEKAMDDWLETNEDKMNEYWEKYGQSSSEDEDSCSGTSSSGSDLSGSKRSRGTPSLKKATKKAKLSLSKEAPKSPKTPKAPKSAKTTSSTSSSTRKCSNCDEPGHYYSTCRNPTVYPPSDDE